MSSRVAITVWLEPPTRTDAVDCKDYVLVAVLTHFRRLPKVDPMSRLNVNKITVDIIDGIDTMVQCPLLARKLQRDGD